MPRPNQPTKYPLLTHREAEIRLGITKGALQKLVRRKVLKKHYQSKTQRGLFTQTAVRRIAGEYGYVAVPYMPRYADIYPDDAA